MARRWAVSMCWSKTWEEALAEALRLNAVCIEKFGPRPDDPQAWVYRVRKRKSANSHHVAWFVYTPTGEIRG